jgi:copper chaperone CopZ
VKTIHLHAPSISCGHCKASIEHDMAAEPGVQRVVVDVDDKKIRIDFEEEATDEYTLTAKLAEIGYPSR